MSGFLDKAKAKLDEVMDNTTLDEKAQDTYAQHGDKVEGAIDQHADRIDQGIDQFGLGAARLEAKRTGQGGLEPVMTRHPGQFVEQGRVQVRKTGPDNGPVGQAIPAEPLAPCLPEGGDRGRGMGDGITHDRVHGGVTGRRLARCAGPARMSPLCPAGFRAGL